MAIKTLRVFAEYTSTGFVPMPTAGGIDYGYTLASTFPSTTPSSFQTDDPDLDVTVTAMTDFYVWIRINGTAWNPSYTRNVRVYPDSPDINNVVMNMIIATGPAGTSSYSQIVQTANRLYFNGATTDTVYDAKFAGKTYINELTFGTAPQLATVATSGAYADLSGKPALSTVATSGSYADLSNKPSGTAPISYNSGTNSFQITQANTSTNGFLSSTDWNTFNAKYLLPSGGTTAQYLRGDGTIATFPTTLDSTRLIFTGRNNTGTTLTKGTVVYINGVSGNTALLARAIATGDSTSAQTLGIVEFDIANNSNGVVVLVGAVNNLDTSSYTEGVQLYLSGTTAGAFTSTKILAPTHLVYVGIVTRAHPTQGVIEVKIQNGYELDELHDVQISSPADKDILYRDAATSLWKHAGVTSVLGYTPYNATNPNNYIALTALSASAPLSYNSTTGAFTIAQANGSTNGFLSSTDWTTFNSKQSALTLGNVTEVSSNVLMFPDGGTGKTIGNLSIQVIQSGASTNGFLSSTDWSTFNNKQATITGGASTITTSNLTASRALISNASGKVDVSSVTSTELGYLSGVTSAIQTQLNAKQATITNPVMGTGTANYIPKWSGTSTIANSLIYETNSSIGIGTITPLALSNTTVLQINGTNSSYYTLGAGGTRYLSILTTSTESKLETNAAIPLIFATNEVERMRLTTGGNLGLGTTSPTGASGITFEINGVAGQARLAIKNNATGSSSTNGLQLGVDTGGAAFIEQRGANSLQLNTNGNSRIFITSAGNVGIGITAPSQPLSVEDTILIKDTQSSASQLIFGDSANDFAGRIFYNHGSDAMQFFVNADERMRITSGGNILMGTTTDNGERLYVSGSIRATGNITANSDLSLKKNLEVIQNPFSIINALNGYSYQWKENDEYQYGVVAQEVEKVYSHAVSIGTTGIRGVAYNQFTPLFIEGLKQHDSEINKLKARVKYLEAKLG